MQVDGAEGLPRLLDKVRGKGPGVLFEGSAATLVSTFVGHYPWFATYNTLQVSGAARGRPARTARGLMRFVRETALHRGGRVRRRAPAAAT
jgi:hypothetical protein